MSKQSNLGTAPVGLRLPGVGSDRPPVTSCPAEMSMSSLLSLLQHRGEPCRRPFTHRPFSHGAQQLPPLAFFASLALLPWGLLSGRRLCTCFSSCHLKVGTAFGLRKHSTCPLMLGQCRSLTLLPWTHEKGPAVVVPCGSHAALCFRKVLTRRGLPVPWTVALALEGSPSACSCRSSGWWTWWT